MSLLRGQFSQRNIQFKKIIFQYSLIKSFVIRNMSESDNLFITQSNSKVNDILDFSDNEANI